MTQEFTLELKKYGSRMLLDEGFTGVSVDVDISKSLYPAATEMFASLKVWGQTLRVVDERFPVSPWDHFKHKYFPEWSRRFFPVKYHHIYITFDEVFPEAKAKYAPDLLGRPHRVLLKTEYPTTARGDE